MKAPIVVLPKNTADGYAIQALARGEASPAAQQRALKCIIEEFCGTYDMTFDPDSDRNSTFAEGRRSVGRGIVNTISANLAKVKAAEKIIAKKKGRKNG